MQRVVVIGTSGSGKTTFAKNLAHMLSCPHYELDELHFLANWETRTWEEMRALVNQFADTPAWVSDGNYSRVRDILWGKADTVVWLNYSFPVAFGRLVQRTFKRMITREELFGGCVETFRSQLFSKESLFLWFFQTHWKRKKEYPLLFQDARYQHLNTIILKNPRQAKRFLAAQAESMKN